MCPAKCGSFGTHLALLLALLLGAPLLGSCRHRSRSARLEEAADCPRESPSPVAGPLASRLVSEGDSNRGFARDTDGDCERDGIDCDVILDDNPAGQLPWPLPPNKKECGYAPYNRERSSRLPRLYPFEAHSRSSSPSRRGRPGQSRIVNGEDIFEGEFPSYATLKFADTKICGGVLLSEWHVLTAAHCMLNKSRELYPPSDVTVTLGDLRLNEKDPYELEYRVRKYHMSNSFLLTPPPPVYDWALLELTSRVEYNNFIQPACLPVKEVHTPTHGPRADCYVMGSGAIRYDSGFWPWSDSVPVFPKTIQKIPVQQVPCTGWPIEPDDKSRVCYTKSAGKPPGDSCAGDSGGPVLCIDSRDRWTVTGLISYGRKVCDEPKGPRAWIGVYTDVIQLAPNILTIMES